MNWSPINWDIPMYVRVPAIALLFCAATGAVLGGIALFFMWLSNAFGDDAAAAVFFGCLVFAFVCFFTWIILEEW